MKRFFIISFLTLSLASLSFAQAPIHLSIYGTQVSTQKVYDGTTACDVTSVGLLSGLSFGDVVSVNAVANYATPNVSTNDTISVTFTLSGPDATKYSLDTIIRFPNGSITPRQLTISGTFVKDSMEYNGSNVAVITALGDLTNVVLGDHVNVDALAFYNNPNVGAVKPVSVVYFLAGGSDVANYAAPAPDLLTSKIYAKQLTGSHAVIQKIKEYDGNVAATVRTPATVYGIIPGDTVEMITSAYYDDASLGSNKNITLHYDLAGVHSLNYKAAADVLYCTDGKIVPHTTVSEDNFVVNADGYCQGDAAFINLTPISGAPVAYRLMFHSEAAAQGFVNSGWVPMSAATTALALNIPTDCADGTYLVDVTFRNEAGVETTPITVPFVVNISVDRTVQIFDDVISVVNTDNRFSTFQWYHNDVAIDGATLPYYQEVGGLTGSYYVRVNMGTPTEGRTCTISGFETPEAKSLRVYPNPVATSATIALEGMGSGEHQLTILNAFGARVMTARFSGIQADINMSSLPAGIYMIEVDGVSVTTIKQ